jgi:hypothetical protein
VAHGPPPRTLGLLSTARRSTWKQGATLRKTRGFGVHGPHLPPVPALENLNPPPWISLRHKLAPVQMRLLPRTGRPPQPASGARLGQVDYCPSFPSYAPPGNIAHDPAATPSSPNRLPRRRLCRFPPSLQSLLRLPSATSPHPPPRPRRRLTQPNIRHCSQPNHRKHGDVGGR